jgi:two-component system, OmpR family, sensor kinase
MFSIRIRLAVSFVLVTAVVLWAFSAVVLNLTRNSLLAEIERDVRQRGDAFAALAEPSPGDATLHLPTLDVFTAPDTFLQVLDVNGAVVATSGNLGSRTIAFHPDKIAAGAVEEARLNGVVLFVYGAPLTANGETKGYIMVARAPRTIYRAVAQMRRILYPGAAIALAFAGLAGLLIVHLTLRPLGQLATSATAIAKAQDHTRRLTVKRVPDEIAQLQVTINGMLRSLEDAYRQVTELNGTQRRFLADVSHELRTPLTIILSSLDLLAKEGAATPEFHATTLADMRVEADRMARMVTQLLILARSDADAAVAYQPVLIEDIVAEACRQPPPLGGSSPPLRACDLRGLDGAVVHGNPDYLRQLFLILLDNAYKYTQADGVVEVTGAVEGHTVAVTVADTGIGIAPEETPQIFERFYRATNAVVRGGTGLGLAIARRITEQHGGTITVESAPNRGSRFTVRLPLINEV